MEFLGVGPAELLLILVIALIVVGPERLPEIARTIAKTLNTLRAMSQSLTAEWQQEMKAVNDIKAGAQELQQSLTEPLKAAQADLQQTLTEPLKEAQAAQTDIRRAFSQPLAAPPSTAAAPPAVPASQPSPTESPSDGADKPASAALFEQPLTPPLMLPLDPPPASDDSAAQPQPAEIPDTSDNHSDQAND
jgi:sec-independent protein translocase protein TatB